MDVTKYEAPRVEDLGDLPVLTQAISVNGLEDGASKAIPLHHSQPQAP